MPVKKTVAYEDNNGNLHKSREIAAMMNFRKTISEITQNEINLEALKPICDAAKIYVIEIENAVQKHD